MRMGEIAAMLYRDLETGTVWSKEEIVELYDKFREESVYMSEFESADEYIDDQVCKGILEPLE